MSNVALVLQVHKSYSYQKYTQQDISADLAAVEQASKDAPAKPLGQAVVLTVLCGGWGVVVNSKCRIRLN